MTDPVNQPLDDDALSDLPLDADPAPDHSGSEVFEILARQHSDMLVAFLRSLVRRPEIVDDLFQETMMVAWRRLADYDRERDFGPWLRGIAIRVVLHHRRRSRKDFLSCEPNVLEGLEGRMRSLEGVPADSFRAQAERLQQCIERLPERQREAINLSYFRGMLLKQIAESVEASEEAIKKRVQHARRLLADCLQTSIGGAA